MHVYLSFFHSFIPSSEAIRNPYIIDTVQNPAWTIAISTSGSKGDAVGKDVPTGARKDGSTSYSCCFGATKFTTRVRAATVAGVADFPFVPGKTPS